MDAFPHKEVIFLRVTSTSYTLEASRVNRLKIALGIWKTTGRPTKYSREMDKRAYKLALLGAADSDIADFFEVSESTVNLWKLEHPSFSESLRAGKVIADTEVAEKLYERAKGYEWTEDFACKVKNVKYENGKKVSETEDIAVKSIRKYVPPDVQAAFIWLRNRSSLHWKEKIEVDKHVSGSVTHTVEDRRERVGNLLKLVGSNDEP